MSDDQAASAPGLPISPETLSISYDGRRRRVCELASTAETPAESPTAAIGGLSVPPGSWPPPAPTAPAAVALPSSPTSVRTLRTGQVVAVHALGSLIDSLYRVSGTQHTTSGQVEAVARLAPAAPNRDPIQAVSTDDGVLLRDGTSHTTITQTASLYLVPDRQLAMMFASADSGPEEDHRPTLRDPTDPTIGAHVATVADHEVLIAEPPAGRDPEPTLVSFVLACSECDYTAHPRIQDTTDLVGFAETSFQDLECPPAFERHIGTAGDSNTDPGQQTEDSSPTESPNQSAVTPLKDSETHPTPDEQESDAERDDDQHQDSEDSEASTGASAFMD